MRKYFVAALIVAIALVAVAPAFAAEAPLSQWEKTATLAQLNDTQALFQSWADDYRPSVKYCPGLQWYVDYFDKAAARIEYVKEVRGLVAMSDVRPQVRILAASADRARAPGSLRLAA